MSSGDTLPRYWLCLSNTGSLQDEQDLEIDKGPRSPSHHMSTKKNRSREEIDIGIEGRRGMRKVGRRMRHVEVFQLFYHHQNF